MVLEDFVDFLGLAFGVELEDVLLLTEVVVAVADGVVVAAYDDELHVGVGHRVAVLLTVVGDADDFAVAG